jgi:hypothetical protein
MLRRPRLFILPSVIALTLVSLIARPLLAKRLDVIEHAHATRR